MDTIYIIVVVRQVNKLVTFNCPSSIEVTIRTSIEPLCPFTGIRDKYSLVITYKASNKCIEAESLFSFLFNYRNKRITQEELTLELLNILRKELEPKHICVELAGRHGAIDMTSKMCL